MVIAHSPSTEIARAEQVAPVIALRQRGHSFRSIAALTGTSKSTVHRQYRRALSELPVVKAIVEHRAEVLVDLELVLEALRPLVQDDEREPSKEHVASFLATIDQKVRLLRLDEVEDGRTRAPNLAALEDNPQAMERLIEFAAWARRAKAINVDGYQPVLPPGMEERVAMKAEMYTRSVRPTSLWEAVVEFPDQEADDVLD